MIRDISKYQRQTILRSFGLDKQHKLSKSKVLIIGCGGLGIPVAQYLNAMGVGVLGLMDQDIIELHNLHRQVLFDEHHVGQRKVTIAAEKLRLQNTQTEIQPIEKFLSPANALEIISGFDVVVDATDNFSARYLVNDSCILLKKPFVYGALHDFEGQVSVFNYNGGPTYRCLFPVMPQTSEIPNCDENGVLGVLPGIIGTLQALEVIKVLTGVGEVLSGKLLVFDGLTYQNRLVQFKLNPVNHSIMGLQESYGSKSCVLIQGISAIDFDGLKGNEQLIDVRSHQEFEKNHLRGAKNLPLPLLEDALGEIDFQQPAYLICQSGKRSVVAYEMIKTRHPRAELYHIEGGMNEMMTL